MISESTMRRAVQRIGGLKFFPATNGAVIADVVSMIGELYSTDSEVERAISNILHEPAMAEWPGSGAFFDWLKRAVYHCGMLKVNGRWVPHPENGPEFDIIAADGSRHWGGWYSPQARQWHEKRTTSDSGMTEYQDGEESRAGDAPRGAVGIMPPMAGPVREVED